MGKIFFALTLFMSVPYLRFKSSRLNLWSSYRGVNNRLLILELSTCYMQYQFLPDRLLSLVRWCPFSFWFSSHRVLTLRLLCTYHFQPRKWIVTLIIMAMVLIINSECSLTVLTPNPILQSCCSYKHVCLWASTTNLYILPAQGGGSPGTNPCHYD